MYSANTLLTIMVAPKDAYAYTQFKAWHTKTKRRWKSAEVMGADEAKVLENNRRHMTKYNRKLSIFGWHQESNVFKDGRQYIKVDATCRVKIACVIVRHNMLLGIGYNGSASGDTNRYQPIPTNT